MDDEDTLDTGTRFWTCEWCDNYWEGLADVVECPKCGSVDIYDNIAEHVDVLSIDNNWE